MPLNIPMPEAPPGGFAGGTRAINELAASNIANEIARIQAQYLPATLQADTASKLAYSQFVGPQALASILTSPNTRGMFNQNDYIRLSNAIAQQISQNGANALSNLPSTTSSGGVIGSLLSSLFGQNKPQTPTQNAVPTNSLITPPAQNQPVSTNQPQTQQATQPTIGYNTPATRQAQSVIPSGQMGPSNPPAATEALEAGQKAAVTGQVQTQNTLKEQRNKMLSAQAISASNALKSLEGFHRNYKASKYKGQYLGSQPSSGVGSIPTLPGHTQSNEQLADTYQNQYLNDIAAIGDTPAGQTDMAREMIKSAKFTRALDPDAEEEIYQGNKAKLKRLKILRHFANIFYQNNPEATDEELVAMMNEYNEFAPPYDYENGKSLPENDQKFKDFTSKDALKNYRDNGYYNPYEKKQQLETPKSTPEKPKQNKNESIKWIKMLKPIGNGKYKNVEVDSRDVDEAIKLNYKRSG